MFVLVPLGQIDDNPFQQRHEYDDIVGLALDIARHYPERPDTFGLQQVPTGRLVFKNATTPPEGKVMDADFVGKVVERGELPEDAALRIQLEYGHRRKRAFDMLAFGEGNISDEQVELFTPELVAPFLDGMMPVYIRQLSDDVMLDGVWSENHQRRDISDVDRALLIKAKLDRMQANGGGSQRDVADQWGVARPTVSNLLRLLQMPEEIKQANHAGQLSQRQCLALDPVIKLSGIKNGTKWDKESKRPERWGLPMKPSKYIEWVIENQPTSDEIREYGRDMLKHAGIYIPDVIRKTEFGSDNGLKIEQTKCHGCPLELSGYCLDKHCFDNKVEMWKEMALQQASEQLGYPISDRDEDFPQGWEVKRQIKQAFESNVDANYVIGWQEQGSGMRPYCNGSDYLTTSGNQHLEGNGLKPIILGVRGALPLLDDIEGDPYGVMRPAPAVIDTWRKEAEEIANLAERDAQRLLADDLYLKIDAGDSILAMMLDADKAWPDEHEKFIKQFVRFMWKQGSGHYGYTNLMRYQSADAVLQRAGLGGLPAPLSDADAVWKAAVLALGDWWYSPYEYHAEKFKPVLQSALELWQKHSPFSNEDVQTIGNDLQIALKFIEQWTSPIDVTDEEVLPVV